MNKLRVGNGYDIHKLVPDRPLILGGVNIPYSRGLLGNTDADVLTHAIIDAILGGLCLGDIGYHFPPDDPSVKDARSIDLLKQVMKMVTDRLWRINNIDSVVIAEQPKLRPHIPAMQDTIAEALGVEKDCVSVKAKTNEKMGPVGEGEAIAAHVVVLLAQ